MRIEFGVHVPAELLSGRLWVVELLLRLALHRLKFILEDLELLFSLSSRLLSIGCAGIALSRLLGNSNHYENKAQKLKSVTTWNQITYGF